MARGHRGAAGLEATQLVSGDVRQMPRGQQVVAAL